MITSSSAFAKGVYFNTRIRDRYGLPVTTIIFNNNGVYRGDEKNPTGGPDPSPLVFVKDARDFRFILLNRAGEEFLGVKREAIIGRTDHDVFPKGEADRSVARDRELLKSRQVEIIEEEPVPPSTDSSSAPDSSGLDASSWACSSSRASSWVVTTSLSRISPRQPSISSWCRIALVIAWRRKCWTR